MVKKTLIITWLTLLWFMLLGNVHAWEVPAYLRVDAGARLWFSRLDGDFLQDDRTKLGVKDNLGLKQDVPAWEFFASARYDNIHVVRFKGEPSTVYDQSTNHSYHKIQNYRFGYDVDFYMSPQALIGANTDFDLLIQSTKVSNVTVGAVTYNYEQSDTRVIPCVGFHGTYYPIIKGVALRPNISTRFGWWDYKGTSTWELEAEASVDIPINRLWTWTMNGGYRYWNAEMRRDQDSMDVNRSGFYLETSLLF